MIQIIPQRYRKAAVCLGWIVLLLAIAELVAKCYLSIVTTTDEAYQAISCRYYADFPMAMGIHFVGWCAMQIFGDNILTLRLLTVACLVVATGIPVWFLYRKSRSATWALFTWACILIIVWRDFFFYGWDKGAYPLESVLLVALACQIVNPRLRWAVTAGIACGLLMVWRVPSAILALPLTAWAICYGNRCAGQKWQRPLTAAFVCFAAASVAAIILMKGSLSAYAATWKPENIISGHLLRDMAYGYLTWLADDIIELLGVCPRYIGAFAGCIFLVYLIWGRHEKPRAFFSGFANGEHLNKADKGLIWLVVLFAFVHMVGSDRLLVQIKIFYSIPILVYLVLKRGGKNLQRLVFVMVTVLSVLFVGKRIFTLREWAGSTQSATALRGMSGIIVKTDDKIYAEAMKLTPWIDLFSTKGIKYDYFGDDRYTLMYYFHEGKPFMFQEFHCYYPERIREVIAEFSRAMDVILVKDKELQGMSKEEMLATFRANGMLPVAKVGYIYILAKGPEVQDGLKRFAADTSVLTR